MNQLPEDIARKIWHKYFTSFVIPEIPVWLPIDSKLYLNNNIVNPNKEFCRIVSWMSVYLNSFHPLFMMTSKMFCKYIDSSNKYKWPDEIRIYTETVKDRDEFIIALQQKFNYLDITFYKNIIKINLRPHLEKWINSILLECDIELFRFDWHALDVVVNSEMTYFRDPYTGQKSDNVFGTNIKTFYDPDNLDPIPWFIYVP